LQLGQAFLAQQQFGVFCSLRPDRSMATGDAGVRAAIGTALGDNRRAALGFAIEAKRRRRIEEAIIQDADIERAGDVSEHGADASRIGNVAGQRIELVDGLLQALGIALKLAYGVVVCELLAISFIRYRFTGGKLANAIVQVVIGSGIAFAIGAWFGRIGVS
jgi:hypothetical protein